MRPQAMLAVLGLALIATPALAQYVVGEAQREEVRGVPDRWGFSVGSFWQTFDTRVRLNGSDGETGTDINVERDLGLPENQTNFHLAGFYRFSDHSRLDLEYVGWSRSRSTTLERQIEWGDVVYDVGVTLSSDTSAHMVNVIYKYSFFNNGKVVFGLNGGLSSMWTDFTLSGEGTVAGGGTASGTLAESKSVIFPVPVVGVHFEMTLARKLVWEADGNFFAATISGYHGSVNEISTSIAYFFTRNVGAGAGFSTTTYKVDTSGDRGGALDARFGFSGATAYVTFAF